MTEETAVVRVNKMDFIWADHFVDLALQEFDKDFLERVREWLEISFDLYRLRHGTHPSYFNKKPLIPLMASGNTKKKIAEFKKLKPWQCFPDTKNAIDLFDKIPLDKNSWILQFDTYRVALAILILVTPHTAENFHSIVTASQNLAERLIVDYLQYLAKIDNRTPAQKKIDGRKKGGIKMVEAKKELAKARDAQIETWISLDNGGRGLARRLRKTFSVSERKAQDIISKVKKKSMQQA